MGYGIREWQHRVHTLAVANGWWDRRALCPEGIAAKLALIHSEVSEALECVRDGQMDTTEREDGKPEGFPSELVDVVIRCLDLAGGMGIDLQEELERKHKFNRTRPFKHGGKTL